MNPSVAIRLVLYLLPVLAWLSPLFPNQAMAACGPIPATYSVSTGSKLDVDKNVTVNGSSVSKGQTGADSVLESDGTISTVSQALPDLDPSALPANGSGTKATEADSPFNSSVDVYYDEIKIGKNNGATFTGGGPFHVKKLEVEDGATINLAAGTYYIDELKLGKNAELGITSEPVIVHVGTKFEAGDGSDVNVGGDVDGLVVYLHSGAEFKAKKNSDVTAVIYGPNADKVELGDNVDFKGAIVTGGEVKIKKNVDITYATADQSAAGAISTCASAVTSVDHYEISHDGSGIICLAEQVTITAHDDAHADYSMDASTTIGLSTSTAKGDWSLVGGAGTLTNSGGGVGSYQWGAESSVTLALKYTAIASGDSEVLSINVSDGAATETTGTADAAHDPALTFNKAGFRFYNTSDANTTLPTQLSGKDSDTGYNAKTLHLQAIKTDDDTGACAAVFANGSDVTVELGSTCVDPNNCLAGTRLSSTNNGNTTALANPQNQDGGSNYSSVGLRFSSASRATLVLNYPDAGSQQLHARYQIPLEDGSPSGDYMTGSSNVFVVRPFGFAVTPVDASAFASDVSGSIFKRAGENFDVSVTAMQWASGEDTDNDGLPDSGADLSDNGATPNFGGESVAPTVSLSHSLADPVSGSAGVLSGGSGVGGFTNGALTTTLSWSEVGIINLSASLDGGSYLASADGLVGNIADVGRFTPDHLAVSVTTGGGVGESFTAACSGFSYLDQPIDFTTNEAPVISITAENAANVTTQNYADYSAMPGDSNWWKLADIVETYSDGGVLPGGVSLDDSAVSHSPATDTDSAPGSVTTTLAGPLTYTRPATGGDAAPFDADISLSFDVWDGEVGYDDGAGGNSFSLAIGFAAGDTQQRHGRLTVSSAAGSELLPLAVPWQAEYFDGAAFALNASDSCTSLTLANHLSLSNADTAGGLPQPGTTAMLVSVATTSAGLGGASMSNGDAGLVFSAPGAANVGYVDLDVDISALLATPYWLQYNWSGVGNHDQNPARARASFGIFSGSPYIIHKQEPW